MPGSPIQPISCPKSIFIIIFPLGVSVVFLRGPNFITTLLGFSVVFLGRSICLLPVTFLLLRVSILCGVYIFITVVLVVSILLLLGASIFTTILLLLLGASTFATILLLSVSILILGVSILLGVSVLLS